MRNLDSRGRVTDDPHPGPTGCAGEIESVMQGPKGNGAPAGDEKPVNRATDTDRYVGSRIRERRVLMGLSQQQMAELIGVTYQQAHKYERGINRISAGRLFEIAQVLEVPVGYFYEGLGSDAGGKDPQDRQRMCLEVARNFSQIDNKSHQEALSHLARALAVK